jgi:hypothetical protein
LKPQGVGLPLTVELFQLVSALNPGAGELSQQLFQMEEEIVSAPIKVQQDGEQRLKVALQPLGKFLPLLWMIGGVTGALRFQAR